MKKKKKVKRVINWQKIFCFASFVFILICMIWYGGRAVHFYLDTRKVIENEDKLLAQSVIDKNFDTDNFKKINSDYYFYKGAKTNYLIYSNILWRIVKINKDNQISLVMDDAIATLAYGKDKEYDDSYINKWLNKNDEDYTGILEDYLNNKDSYLMKTETCIDNVTDIKKVDCKKVNSDNYLSKLSLVDYINTGTSESFINNGKYTYLANNNDDKVWYIDTTGKLNTSDGTDIYGIRATITIKPSVQLISGDGSKNSPYRIEDNNGYYGSYVKLGDDVWRVYEINENKLKLVLNDYLKVDSEKIEYSYSNKNYFHNDTKSGSLAYYLNNTYLNSLSYKDLIIENKYANSYYGEDNEYDYASVVKTMIDTKVSVPSITDPIFNNELNGYFTNTGTDDVGSFMYTRKNTSSLSSTRASRKMYVIPCITIDKSNLKAGSGFSDDPYRTE